ncbi:MAG: hypothetical protein H6965_10680 [Chromatiaceae bacterium]|nr:hypothetical protein [Chromatiaceae bacterium]
MQHKLLITLLLACGQASASVPALTLPSPETLEEARKIVISMKGNERGPYSRIRWFCNDGSSHPPNPYPCTERGGGVQHAEYSADRLRLAQLGWYAGTIVAALTWEELWQPELRHARLRALPLEFYLDAVDDGWVLHQARHYRGRIQVEDEENRGRQLLLQLLEQPGLLKNEFLLARELARVIPHGRPGTDRTREIRHLSQEIAELAPSFNRLRIEVHSRPSSGTVVRVRKWLAEQQDLLLEGRDKVQRLIAGLEELYGPSGRKIRLQAAAAALARFSPEATRLIRDSQGARPAQRIEHLSQAVERLRRDAGTKEPGATLRRLDLLVELEAELRTSALESLDLQLNRREMLQLSLHLLRAAWGAGWLSEAEWDALRAPIARLLSTTEAAASEFAFATRRLSLAAGWADQTVRYLFAEPLLYYSALEPKAERFTDDLLRDSVLLPLGELAHRLAQDGAQAAGIGHRIFGNTTGGLLGINPGVARGRLRVLESSDLAQGTHAESDEIVVLTETVADLNPVAGILTLGEGNPLSHVQMLARNLGIPNATVTKALLPRLREHAGELVVLAVAGDGRVLLERSKAPMEGMPEATVSHAKVALPQPQLEQVNPLRLAQLHAGLSGKVVGPKAANIGELNRLFPDRIAPAIALPFGLFARHTLLPRQRLGQAFRRYQAGELEQTGLNAELDAVRLMVASLTLEPDLITQLTDLMALEFGSAGSYGVFVRSDTNAEDLPQFTGAGLNKTIPHVVGLERQLAAVPQVWSSVYTQRAMAWRARILSNPEAVFASVLLMKSVPSEKSGVMVTSDLSSGEAGLTVSVAWGVGGAVDNESAASRILKPDGSTLLLAEAKAPYRRALAPEGGVIWQPAEAGRVLSDDEMNDLRRLAEEVLERYPPALDERGRRLPWDIEFAFAQGKLWLLQIRPLIQRGRVEADAVVNAQIAPPALTGSVVLDEIAVGSGGR